MAGIHFPSREVALRAFNINTGTVTNASWYSDLIIVPDFSAHLLLQSRRIQETGACTLQFFIQGMFADTNGQGIGTDSAAAGDGFYDLPLGAGKAYADGELGIREFTFGPNMFIADTEAAGDLRGVMDIGNHRRAQGIVPGPYCRIRALTGGTSVLNNFDLRAFWVPA